jgi:Icc-related predicted phosphoesterase
MSLATSDPQPTTSLPLRRFLYVSDLHLDMMPNGETHKAWARVLGRPKDEFGSFCPPPCSDYLILAGDVAQLNWPYYPKFIQYCSQQFKHVFLVPGNHEYYGGSFYDGQKVLSSLTSSNVTVLSNRTHVMDMMTSVEKPPTNLTTSSADGPPPLTIIGCTLWSDIPPLAQPICQLSIADFKEIRGLSTSMYHFFHTQDKKWIEKEIAKAKQDNPQHPILVITHHAPLFTRVSHPKFELTPPPPTNYAYGTNLDSLIQTLPSGSAWIYGHTHHRTRFDHYGVTITTNALGYERDDFTQPYQLQYLTL